MIGITEAEFILARNYNRDVNQLQAAAQGIIDRKDNEIIRLRRQLAAAQRRIAELEEDVGEGNLEILTGRRQ